MIRVSVYSLEELAKLREDPWLNYYVRDQLPKSRMMDQVQILQLEMGLLKMFLWCLPIKSAARNMFVKATTVKSKRGLYDTADLALRLESFEDWDSLTFKLLEKIERVKPRIREYCLNILDGKFKCKLYNNFRLLEFLDIMLNNIRDLVRLRYDKLLSVETQTKTLEEKVKLFRDLVDFTTKRCTSPRELKKLSIFIQYWAYKAASLSFLYSIDGVNEELTSSMNAFLFDLLKIIRPCTSEDTGVFIGVLKLSKSTDSENLLMGEIVANVVDFLLESLVVSVNDSITTLRDDLIILITFLMNQPKTAKHWKLVQVLKQADAVMTEAVSLICSFYVQQTNVVTGKESNVILEFLKKIQMVNAKIKKLFVFAADSSRSKFPMTNILGFIDFLVENLANLNEKFGHNTNFIPFAKHKILTIQEELTFVGPFLKDLLAMQHEQKDFWMKMTNVAYQADHLIDLCQTIGYPIWHTMISLSNLLEQIKFIKSKVHMIRDKHRQTESFKVKPHLNSHHHAQARIEDVVVGFEDEATTIIDKLTRGSSKLLVVSIVGMPGIGKTTLAKKVYNSAQVESYFHRRAWCVVSQSYERRELLRAILKDLVADKVFATEEDEEDLAFKLYQSLKEQRYLIILDDIWDIKAWEAIKQSFPNDENGSRVMFTSRIHNIGLEPTSYYAHPLRLLYAEESSKLLQEKLQLKDGIPSNFSQVAGLILKFCTGLPLSIVVAAGLLGQEVRNLGWWKYIAERLNSKLASERGYMDILQLSYKHLPDFLKPCFLYFAAFREDEAIKVGKLIRLWIAEGFILKDSMRSLENVAMDYLKELIGRSLVIVTKQSAIGEIQSCGVHDLLREMCFANATGENFLDSRNVQDDALHPVKSDQYRLCIHHEMGSSLELNFSSSSRVRSLLISSDDSSISTGFLSLFKFLRVLNFEDFPLGSSLPPEITLLNYLRYLAVKCSINIVPSSIVNLENLETFCVVGNTGVIIFPESIWRLKKLRHVDIGKSAAIFSLGADQLEDTSQLDYLDSFSTVSFCSKLIAEEVLRKIPRVRKLSVRYSYWGTPEQFPAMASLSKLELLKIHFVDKLLCPLKFSFPSTLKKLTVSNFGRPWNEISPIGMLPNLEVLKLESNAFVGERWDVEDGQFLNLKYLKLRHLDIIFWTATFDSFPCLQSLVLKGCSKLKVIPAVFGEITTCETIELYDCPKAESSAIEILLEKQDMGNEGFEVTINNDVRVSFEESFEEDLKELRYQFRYQSFQHIRPPRSKWKCSKKYVPQKVCHQDIFTSSTVNDWVKKFDCANVESRRGTKIRYKYNYQSRKAIVTRHLHEGLK